MPAGSRPWRSPPTEPDGHRGRTRRSRSGNLADRTRRSRAPSPHGRCDALALSPDGRCSPAATAPAGSAVGIWSGTCELPSGPPHDRGVDVVAFLPAGDHLVSLDLDGTALALEHRRSRTESGHWLRPARPWPWRSPLRRARSPSRWPRPTAKIQLHGADGGRLKTLDGPRPGSSRAGGLATGRPADRGGRRPRPRRRLGRRPRAERSAVASSMARIDALALRPRGCSRSPRAGESTWSRRRSAARARGTSSTRPRTR